MNLKLGFFTQPVHPPTRIYGDVLREDREAVILADCLGYCEAFIGEHLADSAETITSSLAFIASLADRCPSIAFGTGDLPGFFGPKIPRKRLVPGSLLKFSSRTPAA